VVWRELLHSAGVAAGPVPSSTALSRAGRRVGVEPLRELFTRLRGPQALATTPGAFLAGLLLVAWDGTQLDVHASDANDEVFIPSRGSKGVGACGKVRLMTLIEVGTHAVIDAVFGVESEQVPAARLVPSLRQECCCWQTGTSHPGNCGHTAPEPPSHRMMNRARGSRVSEP
jgi:hypothetical protein